jgi:hypothetical protein
MSTEVEFSARVRFDLYPESVSGRSEVVYSPARPNHRVEGFEHFFISQLDFSGPNFLKPGGSITASARGIITSEMIASLKNGGKWLVYAGPQKLIGEINNIEWLVPH